MKKIAKEVLWRLMKPKRALTPEGQSGFMGRKASDLVLDTERRVLAGSVSLRCC